MESLNNMLKKKRSRKTHSINNDVREVDFSSSWVRIITTRREQIYRFEYNKEEEIIYWSNIDKTGKPLLTLVDLLPDKFEKLYNYLNIIKEEILENERIIK